MKKSKLTALAMATSMMATAFVGTMTANAEDVLVDKGDVAVGVDLVYNQSKSTATERYVDVYITGAVDVSVMSLKFQTTYGVLTNAPKSELFESYDTSLAAGATNGLAVNASKQQSIYSGGFNNTATEQLFGGGYFGTLKLTVDDAADTFDIEVMSASYVSEYTTGSAVKIKFSDYDKLTVPAFVTEETVTAKSEAFVKEYEGVAAQAFSATLTAEQAAKSVTWTVTDGSKEKTVDTTVDTTVSGESDVVIGLVVSDAVEGLSATVTVK